MKLLLFVLRQSLLCVLTFIFTTNCGMHYIFCCQPYFFAFGAVILLPQMDFAMAFGFCGMCMAARGCNNFILIPYLYNACIKWWYKIWNNCINCYAVSCEFSLYMMGIRQTICPKYLVSTPCFMN